MPPNTHYMQSLGIDFFSSQLVCLRAPAKKNMRTLASRRPSCAQWPSSPGDLLNAAIAGLFRRAVMGGWPLLQQRARASCGVESVQNRYVYPCCRLRTCPPKIARLGGVSSRQPSDVSENRRFALAKDDKRALQPWEEVP